MKRPARDRRGRPGSSVVRRSFALPAVLLEQVAEAAPPEFRGNLDAALRTALEEYVRLRRRRAFERAMEEMAADPQIRAANREIFEATAALEAEALPSA